MSKVNGVLSKINAEYMGPRPNDKPDAGVKSPQFVETVVPDLGRVRITYELYSYTHRGRNKFWAWRAIWADVIVPREPRPPAVTSL